jgi:hypothetical protein
MLGGREREIDEESDFINKLIFLFYWFSLSLLPHCVRSKLIVWWKEEEKLFYDLSIVVAIYR